jgi:hypothetical protein
MQVNFLAKVAFYEYTPSLLSTYSTADPLANATGIGNLNQAGTGQAIPKSAAVSGVRL